jgi:glycosyltransferase involved in cell wall biosynthesis
MTDAPEVPTLSVVVPCRNERGFIDTCVRSLLQQKPVDGGFEVIVADGMSDDGTRDILTRLQTEDDRVRVVDNIERITPCGMNAGITAARGRYIAIAGAHSRYAPDYLHQGVAVLEETGADNVGGALICEGHTRIQRAIAAAHHSAFAVGGARWHSPDYEGPADTVFGGVYRREVFDKIGLFDPELVRNQDDEFNLRLTRARGRIWQSPRMRSWYSPRPTLRLLFKQYFQYGYWKVRVIRKHKLPASFRHVVPGAFVLTFVALPVLAVSWRAAGWAWLALAGAYALASGVAAVMASRRSDGDVLLLMPVVFACYHFAYGTGFLVGVLDALRVRRRAPSFSREITRGT